MMNIPKVALGAFYLCLLLGGPHQITREKVVLEQFNRLIATHPDAELKADMARWRGQGKIRILVDSSMPIMSITMKHLMGKPEVSWPTLSVPVDFFQYTQIEKKYQNLESVLAEKQGGLYHEYVHLRNHFSGKFPLDLNITSWPLEEQARYHWDTEMDAYWYQWKFLKRIGYGHLQVSNEDVLKKGEWLAFIDELLKDLTSPEGQSRSQYYPYWRKYHQTERTVPRYK